MNSRKLLPAVVIGALSVASVPDPAPAAGDPGRGAEVFRVCAACHALEPGRHLTGPSLAGVYGRKAGTAEGFRRYSAALKESGLVWNEETLDAFLEDPQALVPGNRMTFAGIRDPRARADLVAFLKQAGAGAAPRRAPPPRGMGGMMAAPRLTDLAQLPPEHRVTHIRYCSDSYFVTVASGETLPFWEFNLRFKTDSNPQTGPRKGEPVIVGAGMRGDRASIVFARPEEISRSIERNCE